MQSTRLLAAAGLIASGLSALTAQPQLPRVVQKDGRYALFVDGAPFLILGAQVNSPSAWPAMLPKVWLYHRLPARQYCRDTRLLGAVRTRAGPVRLFGDRHVAGASARARSSLGSALVWHLEERQFALHATVDEARSRTVPAHHGRERPPGGFAIAARERHTKRRPARICRAHAAFEDRRRAPNGHHGAGGK